MVEEPRISRDDPCEGGDDSIIAIDPRIPTIDVTDVSKSDQSELLPTIDVADISKSDLSELLPTIDVTDKSKSNRWTLLPKIDVTDVSKSGTELNLLLHEKLTVILQSDPKLCFAPSTVEQKRLSHLMYLFGDYVSKQLPPSLGHTNPAANSFFNRCFERFADEYLADLIAQLPHDFGRVVASGKLLAPRAFAKKICNDCFRQRYRTLCTRKTR